MNLHKIASSVISRVNPMTAVTIRTSNGSQVMPNGNTEPLFNDIPNVKAQIQPLSSDDLKQMEGQNLQSIKKAVYVHDHVYAIRRNKAKGGDLIIIDGETWLVTQELEQWSDWCKVAVTLQVDT